MTELEANLLPQDICRTAFESMASKQFEEAERLLGYHMSQTQDPVALGLFHSAMGVAAKMQGKLPTNLLFLWSILVGTGSAVQRS